jgi:predicted RNase H-like HicB family nuclease
MHLMRFLVRMYLYKHSYSAMLPDLPGCIAAGSTVEEVHKLIAEAADLHVGLMRQSGETVPRPAKHLELNIDDLEEGELCTWVEVDLLERKTGLGRPTQ